ncbi:MAG: hypothetical protein RIQ89_2057 [Bacteroidota bacterium]|jgi:hypothetical protein
MRIAKNFQKHVFCLEGDWNQDLRKKSSMVAALDFLQTNCGIKYIHKTCGTKENLKYYLQLWKQQRYRDYNIAYLAFHGQKEVVKVGDDYLNLEEMAEVLNGSCVDKIIHFGSCNTLDTDERKIKKFLSTTRALCICGFRSDIDFLESSVFDMLLMQKFQEFKDVKAVERDLKKNYRKLMTNLNFRIIYN